MPELPRLTDPRAVVTGWDFSTGAVKCLAFDLDGKLLADARFPTDIWSEGGVRELNLMQLEGQARATTRAIAAKLRAIGRLDDWAAGGVSATHHSGGRIDEYHNQIRRAICWHDPTLAKYHAVGLERLGGLDRVHELIGGPWAIRYTLSHLVKDEAELSPADWRRTLRILTHGPLACGYLTGRFDVTSVSAAASTGIMDFRTNEWAPGMLDCLANPEYRELAWKQLPRIIDGGEPLGPLADHLALECGLSMDKRPLIYPNSDDQAAGLVGGGAVDAGQVAVVLGNSAVVNSSSAGATRSGTLDVMRLNWGPYLWMRCYNNGAQFLDSIVGTDPDWPKLEAAAKAVPAGCGGVGVLPFVHAEPSRGVTSPRLEWFPTEPTGMGVRFRASLEALAYLIALGVREHESAGQKITEISVSGGIAKSDLMLSILATVLGRPLKRLESTEGPALGAAVTALAAHEQHLRTAKGVAEPFTIADAVRVLVRYGKPANPVGEWAETYRAGLAEFERRLR